MADRQSELQVNTFRNRVSAIQESVFNFLVHPIETSLVYVTQIEWLQRRRQPVNNGFNGLLQRARELGLGMVYWFRGFCTCAKAIALISACLEIFCAVVEQLIPDCGEPGALRSSLGPAMASVPVARRIKILAYLGSAASFVTFVFAAGEVLHARCRQRRVYIVDWLTAIFGFVQWVSSIVHLVCLDIQEPDPIHFEFLPLIFAFAVVCTRICSISHPRVITGQVTIGGVEYRIRGTMGDDPETYHFTRVEEYIIG